MGFSKTQSEIAIRNHGNVQVALESIFVYTKGEKCKIETDFVFYLIDKNSEH